MFTVLIAEKEHIDAIQQGNKLFFEPFLENKELAFCYWNPAGQNLEDSVPGLMDAVGRHRNWRAVVISSGAGESQKKRNPFDVVDCSAIASLEAPRSQPEPDEDWDLWEAEWKAYYEALSGEKEKLFRNALELPLQKLATWLCFRPEDYILNDVQEKQDIEDWAMKKIGRDSIKPSVRLEQLEREQYKRELRMKETLRREFLGQECLNIAYPSEMHCISTRTTENDFFDPDAYWNIRNENAYSAFADRNMYFDKMRFMVFDLLAREHRNFRTDYIRFLATVLIFISNPLPVSAMQTRRLYCLETETDDTPLCRLVTSYDKKLAATAEVIESEMDKIRSEIPGEMSDKAALAMFCTSKDIPVQLDASCDPDKVLVDNDYGLFFDYPEDEFHKWNRDHRTSKEALAYIAKQQARAVRKSISHANLSGEISDENISRLTSFQIDDVREFTNTAEDELVAAIPRDLSDISGYTDRMNQESEKVRKTIGTRMTGKTTMILASVCLGLYLICFLPFIFANFNTLKGVTNAVVLCVAMLGILALIMFITLLFLRHSVKKAVKAYNGTVESIMNEVQAALKQHSRYLTAFANVRRGHMICTYTQKNLDEYTRSLRIRKKHQEDIRKQRAYLAEDYSDYFADNTFCDETMSRPFEYDFSQKAEYVYPAPFLAGDGRQIEFISSGNFVSVPSSYVKRILVRMEGIYE